MASSVFNLLWGGVQGAIGVNEPVAAKKILGELDQRVADAKASAQESFSGELTAVVRNLKKLGNYQLPSGGRDQGLIEAARKVGQLALSRFMNEQHDRLISDPWASPTVIVTALEKRLKEENDEAARESKSGSVDDQELVDVKASSEMAKHLEIDGELKDAMEKVFVQQAITAFISEKIISCGGQLHDLEKVKFLAAKEKSIVSNKVDLEEVEDADLVEVRAVDADEGLEESVINEQALKKIFSAINVLNEVIKEFNQKRIATPIRLINEIFVQFSQEDIKNSEITQRVKDQRSIIEQLGGDFEALAFTRGNISQRITFHMNPVSGKFG